MSFAASHRNTDEIPIPPVTFKHIYKLIESLKGSFEANLNNEAWMHSGNSTAVLIKNLQILYEDNNNKHADDTQYPLCPPKVAQKLLRLVFRWGKKAPQAIQFLEDTFGKNLIDELHNIYKNTRTQQACNDTPGLVCIDSTLAHENEKFRHFVGAAKNVYVSTDEENIALFLEVFKKPEFYKEEIFNHPCILYFALAACRKGEITPEQYAVLSQWLELRKCYGKENVKVYPLLDEDGNFTHEAEAYFLKYILNKKRSLLKNALLEDKNIAQFKAELMKLPEAERIFIRIDELDKGYNKDIMLAFEGLRKTVLVGEDSIKQLAFLPLTAYQKFINTAFPKHPATLLARLGPISLLNIQDTHRKNLNIVSTYHPRPKHLHLYHSNRFFHLTGSKSSTVVGLHDMFHGLMLSYINRQALSAVQFSADVIREYTGIDWSTGLWKIADAAFAGKDISDEKDATHVFFQMLHASYHSIDTNHNTPRGFLPEIAAVFLDIHFKPEKFALHINTAKLSENLSFEQDIYWTGIKKYSNFFNVEDDPKFNIFKAAIIYEGQKASKPEIEITAALIGCNILWSLDKKNLLDAITLKKLKKYDAAGSITFACLHWQNTLFDANAYANIYNAVCKCIVDNISESTNSAIIPHGFLSKDALVSYMLYTFKQNLSLFKVLISQNIIDINQPLNKFGETFLHLAARENNIETVRFLIANGADVNAKDIDGRSPLFYTLLRNRNPSLPLIQFMLEKGADIYLKDKGKHSILYFAARGKHTDIFKFLIRQEGVNLTETLDKKSWLDIAFQWREWEIAADLLEKGAKDGEAFLEKAIDARQWKVVFLILEKNWHWDLPPALKDEVIELLEQKPKCVNPNAKKILWNLTECRIHVTQDNTHLFKWKFITCFTANPPPPRFSITSHENKDENGMVNSQKPYDNPTRAITTPRV
jgi:hypothetical protein